MPITLLASDKLPRNENDIVSKPTKDIIKELNRQVWVEGLYVRKNDLYKIKRYERKDGNYKNDFDSMQFWGWVKAIEENTAICTMEHKNLGKGVFVPSGKKLPKGSFIPSSGIIKLNPSEEELATKVHCSALQDFKTFEKKIYGLIDPSQKGGILDLINHAPDKSEMTYFNFQNSFIKERVTIANLKSTIKFYNGYAIMGLEAIEDIEGGEHGQQLLWSYARSDEYLEQFKSLSDSPILFLFDNRNGHNGAVIDPRYYSLRKITLFIDTGEFMVKKVATLTHWELMEDTSEAELLTLRDHDSTSKDEPKEFYIEKSVLHTYLKKNPLANRIILNLAVESRRGKL